MDHLSNEELTVRFLRDVDTTKAITIIMVISIAALSLLIYLLYFAGTPEQTRNWVRQLPALNAFLNSASTVLIISGYIAIRKQKFRTHMKFMLSAFVTSCLFLVSYLIYHQQVGHTPFPGQGFIRPVYFTILISHIILSAAVVPLVLTSYYFAFSGKFQTHRKVSRWTFPIWLYVSITGVMIFFILRAYV